MSEERHLHILWTNADPLTSEHMVMMYATNSMLNGWWDKVTVILWGAPAKYVTEDAAIQERIKMAKHAGVEFSACISCALNIGVREKLEALEIETKRWGQPLTELLQEKKDLIVV